MHKHHTHTHTHTRTCTHACTHTYTHTYMYMYCIYSISSHIQARLNFIVVTATNTVYLHNGTYIICTYIHVCTVQADKQTPCRWVHIPTPWSSCMCSFSSFINYSNNEPTSSGLPELSRTRSSSSSESVHRAPPISDALRRALSPQLLPAWGTSAESRARVSPRGGKVEGDRTRPNSMAFLLDPNTEFVKHSGPRRSK